MKASHSQMQCYKSCRKLWFLKYKEGMKSTQFSEPLERGSRYHDCVDEVYKNGMFETTGNPKYDAMAFAYEKYIYPVFKVKESEKWFEYRIPKESHTIVGRIDGVCVDGVLVEHKTVSGEINEEYMYQLNFDEQVLTYMLCNDTTEMWYTVCRTPTIRQRKGESDDDFMTRCVEWYETDTDKKITYMKITRTKEQIDTHKKELVELLDEMEYCNSFYRNTGHCNKWGRFCEYSSICLDYSKDKEYVGFTRWNEMPKTPKMTVTKYYFDLESLKQGMGMTEVEIGHCWAVECDGKEIDPIANKIEGTTYTWLINSEYGVRKVEVEVE